jgi:hypothetical protein
MGAEAKRGRPPVWGSAAAKQREYRQRQGAKAELLAALLHAVRNARLEDPALQAAIAAEDDLVLLEALVAHYRGRYWMRPPPAKASE